ncbi:type I methionyl aminopeptidase [soil metagenome]
MSLIKTPKEISSLRKGGKLLGEVLQLAGEAAKPGVTMLELEATIAKAITDRGAKPSFLGFDDYPMTSCLSVNDELVHGLPRPIALKEGDILGIDVGLWFEGLCVDSAITVAVGNITPEAQALLDVTQEALLAGIKAIKPFRKVGGIGAAVQAVGEAAGVGIVRVLTGHGVGHAVHEDPSVPNLAKPTDGILLRPGMVLAIEPMFTLGAADVVTDVDGWTIRTRDGSLSAQFEHTVVVTSRGAEILTVRPLHLIK